MSALEGNPKLEIDGNVFTGDRQQCEPVEVEIFAVDDDTDDDIDWPQLAREAHADFEAGNFNFISTHEDPVQARAALRRYLDDILEEVLNGIPASSGPDAACR